MRTSAMTMQRWGGLASFLLAIASIVAPLIYLTGNLRDAFGPLAYGLADFLYGPVWAASLVTMVFVLREHMGEAATRRMNLALLAAALAAGMMVAAAMFRSTNRQYHLMHPELNLEMSAMVLLEWTTRVAGVLAAGQHFMGWALVLIGSAGWTSRRLPRLLSALYLVVGATSLFAYLQPEAEIISVPVMVMSIWQGILLWKAEPEGTRPPDRFAAQPDPI